MVVPEFSHIGSGPLKNLSKITWVRFLSVSEGKEQTARFGYKSN